MFALKFVLWLCLSVVTAIELQCEFKTMESNENFYACDVKDPRVDSSRTIVTSIKGDHLDGRKNSDVNSFRVYHSSLLRAIPQGLENFFPNLTMISVVKTRLSSITQSTLKPLTELTVLDLTMNKIRVLESGLFKFNTKLTDVYFGNNPLNAIAGDILEPLVSLKVADFSNNLCINMANFDDRHSLEDIRKEIVAKCQNEAKVEPTFLLDVDCASTTSGTSHDTNNTPVQSVKFPFLVALVAATDSRFICGGSLITAKHVLSAAHCVHPLNGAPLPVDDIILHFGLASSSDDGLLKRNVAEIFFHHSWTGGQQEADLAILLADQPVELSEKIKPVCMMHSPIYFQPSNGTVAGLENLEKKSEEPTTATKQSKTYTVTDEECFGKQLNHNTSYLPRSFCGKNANNDPCSGKSGFGFYVAFDDKWTLEGIQSNANGNCNENGYTSYTMISEFTFWLKFTVDGFL